MAERDYHGLLVIGDPHLEGRQPGFRKDDYPNVVLDKLAWCLDCAAREQLLPALLGDVFDKPRDNPTWMIGRLFEMFQGEIIGLYGNHDCAEPALNAHDTLSLLVKSGRLRLVDEESPWRGTMNGRAVVVGGSSYRRPIPKRFDAGGAAFVIWLTHHDVIVPGYEEQGRVKPRELEGIDLVVNGHIHRRSPDVETGKTLWTTPGNISRRSRNDLCRDHQPAVLRIDVSIDGLARTYVEVPHRPFDEVFHELVVDQPVDVRASAFVAGLAELQARRTVSGAGLMEFLDANLAQFEPGVAGEVLALAKEVTSHDENGNAP